MNYFLEKQKKVPTGVTRALGSFCGFSSKTNETFVQTIHLTVWAALISAVTNDFVIFFLLV